MQRNMLAPKSKAHTPKTSKTKIEHVYDEADREEAHQTFLAALDAAVDSDFMKGKAIATIADGLWTEVSGLSVEGFEAAKRDWRARLMSRRLSIIRNERVPTDYTLGLFEKAAKMWDNEERRADGNARTILSMAFRLAHINMRDGTMLPPPSNHGTAPVRRRHATVAEEVIRASEELSLEAVIATMQPDDIVKVLKRLPPDELGDVLSRAALDYLASAGQCARVQIDVEVSKYLEAIAKAGLEITLYERAKSARNITPEHEVA